MLKAFDKLVSRFNEFRVVPMLTENMLRQIEKNRRLLEATAVAQDLDPPARRFIIAMDNGDWGDEERLVHYHAADGIAFDGELCPCGGNSWNMQAQFPASRSAEFRRWLFQRHFSTA